MIPTDFYKSRFLRNDFIENIIMRCNSWCLVLCFILSTFHAIGQDTPREYVDYVANPQQYKIADILIEGAAGLNENAILSTAGLRTGKTIIVPSEDISNGLKALYKLRLFSNVEIIQEKIEGEDIYLKIKLSKRPTLSRYTFRGVKESKHDDLAELVRGIMSKGGIVTIDAKERASQKIADYFVEKGKLDTEVTITEEPDEKKEGAVKLIFEIDTKERVKIQDITFTGNEEVSDRKLRKLLKNTKRKGTFLRRTKFIPQNYKEDKENIIAHYNKLGYRDAKILRDSIWREEDGDLRIHIDLEEGNQYYFRDITWSGNSLYTKDQLSNVLGILPGEVYNPELLEKRLSFSLDGRDVSSLYVDQGYLFFDIQPIEIAIENDSIDIEMRIREGALATVDRVIINGNDRTNEHVIRRELRTKPGENFSRSDIIRSQRQLMNLGYFNPETMDIQPKVNQASGTADIVYNLEERPSDQLELSAGYGGAQGLIGTLGVTFNNFSLANIGNKQAWNPLPQGDGQRLSLRIQSNSRFFRSYNFSFTEPWLGGKKPNSFTLGTAVTIQDFTQRSSGKLSIARGFVGLGTQLKFPDDFFVSNTLLNIEQISLENYNRQFSVNDGSYKNFNIRQTFSRSSVNEPIFPRRGSKVSLSIQFTPPYSLFRSDNFWVMSESERAEAIFEENLHRGFPDKLTKDGTGPNSEAGFIQQQEDARKFSFLEYHKWRFDAEWYFNIIDKLVMMTSIKTGFLGHYNSAIGDVPFERVELGGDGLSNQNAGITGTDIISLRGYEVRDIHNTNNPDGATVFSKYTVEMRYPLSTNPNSTIYLMGFLQGGNAWDSFREYNPFDVHRSVGFGMRVFLPMFGLLGFDYGFGLDKEVTGSGGLGKFSIILGFEPE